MGIQTPWEEAVFLSASQHKGKELSFLHQGKTFTFPYPEVLLLLVSADFSFLLGQGLYDVEYCGKDGWL